MKNKVPKLRFPEFSGEWEEKRLGDVIQDNQLGGNYENTLEKTLKPLIKMGNLSRGKINLDKLEYIPEGILVEKRDILKYGDILFNTRNTLELVGKVAIWRNELPQAFFNSNLMRLNLKNSDNFFINYLFNIKNNINKLRSIATGTTSVAAIYTKDLMKLYFYLPSLPEQEKIANFLSSVDIKIDKLEKKKELLEKYKKGMMQKLFSQKLRFKDENGNDYPEWEEKKLGDIGDIISGLTYSPNDIVKKGLLVLRSSNVQDRTLKFEDNVYVDVDTYNPVKENDILICVRNGSKQLIGKNALITKENEGLAFGAFMSVFRSSINKFVFQYFDTFKYKKKIYTNLGATINSINGSDLKKFEIDIPSLPEQKKIANFLSSIDKKIELVEQELEKNKEFKKGLLQQMFV